jgi:fructose-bisphosphate aldolase class II
MALIKTKEILEKARAERYAVGAFNINNMETVQAIIEGACEMHAPVIVEVSESASRYMGIELAASMVKSLAEKAPVPVALHLDHGKKMEIIARAIKAGFGSVMIDASDQPYAENVARTGEVVAVAHRAGVAVEAELGRLPGTEDDITAHEREAFLIDPDEAGKFVQQTGIDFLAPAIGTAHGAFKFKGEAELDFDRLEKVRENTGMPLVLHGASGVHERLLQAAAQQGLELEGAKGLDDETLKKAVAAGINKVNTDTDLRIAFTTAVRKVLKEQPGEFDPRKILGPAREYMKEVVKERIAVLGSENKG